jgi:hypothetical protein
MLPVEYMHGTEEGGWVTSLFRHNLDSFFKAALLHPKKVKLLDRPSMCKCFFLFIWRKLHNEELHNFYSSPSIIRIIKSRRMRWSGHVARMGKKRNAYRIKR